MSVEWDRVRSEESQISCHLMNPAFATRVVDLLRRSESILVGFHLEVAFSPANVASRLTPRG